MPSLWGRWALTLPEDIVQLPRGVFHARLPDEGNSRPR
jgi:hypothetical protein